MADVTVKRTEDFEPTFMRRDAEGTRRPRDDVRSGSRFCGCPPNADRYPEHDHAEGGQEEVYIGARGPRATLHAGDEEHELEPGVFARVGPNETRKLVTGEEGAVILALGGSSGAGLRDRPAHRRGRAGPARRQAS